MRMTDVPRLHLISDSHLCDLADFSEIARRAVEGGVDAVHLREKETSAGKLLVWAELLRENLSGHAYLIVNDRVDVAMIAGADGVQLGQASMPVWAVRALVGNRLLIGRSIHDTEGAKCAEEQGADFVIAGHVYETASKRGVPGRGLKFVEAVAAECSIPVIAIGGITPGRVPDVIRAGAHGVAVLSGILKAPDPVMAARSYAKALESCGDQREIRN